MEEKIISQTLSNKATDEIDLKDIIRQLWMKRRFILITTGVFFLLGIFIALTSPVSYSASSTIVPQSSQRNTGNLGGLASMMGVNLASSMTGETLSPTVYPNIVKSVPFCREIMQMPIPVKKSSTPITLYEYYNYKQYQQKNLLNAIKKYTIGLPGVILSSIHKNTSNEEAAVAYTDTISGEVLSLTSKERKAISLIQQNILFESNFRDGYIKLGYSFAEPEAAAAIADHLFKTLEKYVKDYKAQKQQDNLLFVESNYSEARKDFLQKQTNLAAFQDANRGLVSAMARTTERRLSSEYDIAFTVYNELAKQLEQAKLSVKESTPVLTIIDPVVVPQQRSTPRRSMIIAVFLFLGLIVSTGWVLIEPLVQDIVKEVKEEK